MQLTTITVSVALAAFLPSAFGHGQVHNFITAKKTYAAADAYAAVDPNSPIRKLNTYGPAADFTNINITCGEGGNTPVAPLAEVAAGETVTFDWGSWTSSHSGPVMTYIAKCPNGCANFKGDTGNVWVKIDQDQFNPTRTGFEWGENIIRMKGNKYSVQIPDLEPGEYLLRHEILGLHVAGTLMGAQFYPNCVQIKLTGTGKKSLPAGIPLPGSYDPRDTGILVQLWQITAASPNYTAPGGAVILPGGTGDWGVEQFGGGAIGSKYPGPVVGAPVASPPPAKPPVTSAPTPSAPSTASPTVAKPPTSAPAPTPTGASVQKYGQCGGQGYTGPTACVVGSTCQAQNDYYSQCV
ncbi:family 61 endoglucanase [Cristinia sonorae]|uniref:lytic cellulose monooxygenase (C4-dehydrogenating) n=1 Tax=Cristinia sonorae TaxID=1940300 RepID=A0A8K0UHP1_9AGAR|nr:family 61 endoglucanase [Cristinia sonorae]